MSINYDPTSIIKNEVSDEVIKQLSVRKNVVSKRVGRTTDDILFLNSNTGFFRISSAVNWRNAESDNEYSNKVAKENILFAGLSKLEEGKIKLRGGLNDTKLSGYKQSDTFGIKPRPGVGSIDIEQRGGSEVAITTCKFDITVPSISDLGKIEALYLTPGFHILVEWGHTLYYDNNSELVTIPTTYDIESFFNKGTKDSVLAQIKQKVKDSDGNYGALFGKVAQFSWDYDGGSYICQVTVNGLGADYLTSPDSIPASTQSTKDEASKNTVYNSTDIQRVLSTIKNNTNFVKEYVKPTEELSEEVSQAINDAIADKNNDIWEYMKQELGRVGKQFKPIEATLKGTSTDSESEVTKYITLRELLILLNGTVAPRDENKTPLYQFYVGDKDNPRKNNFLTFDQHFAIDPAICILCKSGDVESKFNYDIAKQVKLSKEDSTDVLNIYLSIDFILKVFEQVLNRKDSKDRTTADIVKLILQELNDNLGGINQLQLFLDDENIIFYIVDEAISPEVENIKREKDIDVVGLGSLVTGLKVNSTIDSSIVNTMAIAAASEGDYLRKATLGSIKSFYGDLEDRYSKAQVEGNASPVKGEENDPNKTIPEKTAISILSYLKIVNKNTKFLSYSSSDINNLKNSHRELMASLLDYNTKRGGASPAGNLPLKINLTLKGIMGFKVGNYITIQDRMLPERYRGNLAFRIETIGHAVDEKEWTTEIGGNAFGLKKPGLVSEMKEYKEPSV